MSFPLAINRYRALIFDLDGTLIDSMPWHVLAWRQVGLEHGFEVDPKFIYDHGGVSSHDVVRMFKEMGHEVGDIDEFVSRKVELYRQNIDKVQAFPKILEILVKAKQNGVKIGIGSGTQRMNAVDILKRLNIESLVDVIVSANDVKRHKPFPDTFLQAQEALGVEKKDCLIFEDGPLGLEAAKNAGMDCVFVRSGEFVSYSLFN